MAFQTAAALALREAAAATRMVLLEPVDEVAVLVPDDLVGTVMSDLSGRRGKVLGSEPAGEDRTLVRAEVPQMEISRYSIDLRAFSHGAASFTRSFARYEPMPDNVAARAAHAQPDDSGVSWGSAGWIASLDRDARCASQWSTSSSYAACPISSTSSGPLLM